MSKMITLREFRHHLRAVLRRVKAGETIRVANHGEVVAVLSPAQTDQAPRVVLAKHRGGFAAIPRMRSQETTRQALDVLREE